MPSDEEFSQLVAMIDDGRNLVISGIRARHPEYSSDQVRWAARRFFLGDELFSKTWPGQALLAP